MYRFLLLYLLAIVGIFIEPAFLGSVGIVLFKILVLICISYFLFDIWRKRSAGPYTEDRPDDEPETNSYTVEEETVPEPFFDITPTRLTELLRSENDYFDFLTGQFKVIWNFVIPHNGYIFYHGNDDEYHILHKQLRSGIFWNNKSNASPLFMLINSRGEALIENNIESASNVLPFYDKEEYVPRSLLALVTDLEQAGKLYWIFDADSVDFFNREDLEVLTQINRNTRLVLYSATRSSGLAEAFGEDQHKLDLSKQLNLAENVNECLNIFSDFLSDTFQAAKLTIAFESSTDEQKRTAVIRKEIGIDDPFKTGYQFPLDEGLNGWVIVKNKPYLIEDIENGEYFIPRFCVSEKTNYGIRSFLSVPIQLDSEAVGMITLEDKEPKKYTNTDKNRLMEYSEMLSYAIKRFQRERMVEE